MTTLADRYDVVRTLGRGASTVIYAARDGLLGEDVALKVLPERDRSALDRLRTEVRTARRISHPNVCRVHDLHEGDDAVFLVMELVEGDSLATPRPPGTLTRTLDVVRQAGAGLAAAHRAGVVHRDVDPRNILVLPDRVVLVGFERAGVLGADASASEQRQDVARLAGIVRGLLGDVAGELAAPARAAVASAVARAEAGEAESADALVAGILAAVGSGRPRASVPAPELGLRDVGARRLATLVHVSVAPARASEEEEEEEERLDQIDGLLWAAEAALTDAGGLVVARQPHSLTAVLGARTSTADEPVRAADAARAIVAAATSSPEVEVRVGIDAGRVTVRESGADVAVTGDAVREAERLARSAGPGEVLASWRAARPLASRFRLEPPRAAQVRILPRLPVETLDPGAPLFGRERELGRIVGTLAPAREGSARALLMVGPPGIGKSRLRRAAVETLAGRAGFRLVHASTRPDDVLASFAVVRALLAHLPEGAAALAGLRDEADAARTPAAAAVKGALAAAAQSGPLLLVVDDVHWADDASLAILGALAAGEIEGKIATLLVARPEALERRAWPPSLPILELGPLPPDQALRVVTAHLGEGTDPEAAQQIVSVGEGNPFFLEELARDHAERQGTGVGGSLPSSVQQTIQARLDRLPAAARQVLRAAAVLGRRFERSDLEGLLAQVAPGEDVAAALDGVLILLERKQLMFPLPAEQDGEERYLIKHALVRDVAYAELAATARRALHAAAGRVLAGRARDGMEDLVALAGHLESAEDAPGSAAVFHRAGKRAYEIGAMAEAHRCLERACLLLGDQAPLPMLLDLVTAAREVAAFDQAVATLARVLAMTEAPAFRLQRAQALHELGKIHSRRAEWERAVGCLRDALALLDDASQPVLAGSVHREIGWVLGYARGDSAAGMAEARRAVELLEPLGPSVELGRTYDCLAAVSVRAGDWRQQLEWNLAHLALSQNLGPISQVHASTNVGENHRNLGDLEAAERHTRRALTLAEKLCMTRNRAYCCKNLAWFAIDRLELDAAEKLAAEALRLASLGGAEYWRVDLDFILARVAVRRGDLATARRHVDEGIARAEAARSTPDIGIGKKYLGEVLSHGGDHDAALAALDEAEAILVAADRGELARTWAARSRALVRAGRPDADLRERTRVALGSLGAQADLAVLDDLAYV